MADQSQTSGRFAISLAIAGPVGILAAAMETTLEAPAARPAQQPESSSLTPLRAVGLSLIINAVLCVLLMYPWKTDGYDQMFYYAQARSLAYDGDLFILNDLRAELPADAAAAYDQKASTYTPRRLPIPYSIGQPAVTLPLHLGVRAAHVAGILSDTAHRHLARAVPVIVGLLMAVATLAVLSWVGMRIGGRPGMGLNVGLYVASPMPYYFFCDTSTAHTAAIFWSAMLVPLLMRSSRGVNGSAAFEGAVLGTVIGWLVVTRWQILPILAAVAAWRLWTLRADRGAAGRFLAAMALCSVPLFVAQYVLVQVNNPLGSGAPPMLATSAPRPLEYMVAAFFGVLLSDFNGLFYAHPALLVGMIAAASRLRHPGQPEVRVLAWGAFALLALATASNALILDWWGSYAFGGRRFDFAIPWLAAAGALAAGSSPARARVLGGVVIVLAAWNIFASMRFRLTDTMFFDYWSPRLTAFLFREGVAFRFSAPARIWWLLTVPAAMAVVGSALLMRRPVERVQQHPVAPGIRRALLPVLLVLPLLLLAGSLVAVHRTSEAYRKEAVAGARIKAPAPGSFESGGMFDSGKNPFWLFYETDAPDRDRLRRQTLQSRYHRIKQFKANRHPIELEWFRAAWEERYLAPYGGETGEAATN